LKLANFDGRVRLQCLQQNHPNAIKIVWLKDKGDVLEKVQVYAGLTEALDQLNGANFDVAVDVGSLVHLVEVEEVLHIGEELVHVQATVLLHIQWTTVAMLVERGDVAQDNSVVKVVEESNEVEAN